MKLTAAERRRNILEILKNQDFVKIDALAKQFSTSEITIRRDLDKLDNEGLLKRTFGGAEKRENGLNDFFYDSRINVMKNEKERIGLFAANLVKSRDVVFINSGTTTLYVARALKNIKGVIIVTNSILIFIELRLAQDIELILLGGNYRPAIFAFTGPIAEQGIENIRAKYAFLGTDGITHKHGVTSEDIYATPIIKKMMKYAENSILVSDSSKFGKVGSVKYANINDFDGLIVDDGISDEDLKEYRTNGLTIYRV